MSPTEAAEIALRVLHSLAQLQPAVDGEGHSLQPLPTVHRILASPQCLPHIAQVLIHPSSYLASKRITACWQFSLSSRPSNSDAQIKKRPPSRTLPFRKSVTSESAPPLDSNMKQALVPDMLHLGLLMPL